jgi:hypothetical protein
MANGDYSEKFIQAKIWDHYYNIYKYMFTNMKYFSLENENDFIAVTESGLTYEYEIKTRKFDFADDFKKVSKHEKLKAAYKCKDNQQSFDLANKFFYACPPGIIDKKDVPPYAGLIYVDENKIRVIKSAPLLHRYLWNPARYFDRIYLKAREYINADLTKVLETFKVKRNNKTAYKRKKYTPKSKHPEEDKFLGVADEGIEE